MNSWNVTGRWLGRTVCGVIGLLSVCNTGWSQPAPSTAATEKTIKALENQWLLSQKTNNPDIIAPALAEKFVSTDPDGKFTDKASMLADAKARHYDTAEYQDVHVTVFGNTAIATGGFKGRGTDASGKSFEEHDRWTDTWVKMPDGKWQCVASQDSPVTK